MRIFSKNRFKVDGYEWVHDKNGKINVSNAQVRQQLQFIQLTEVDLGLIQAFGEMIQSEINDVVDSFYRKVLEVSELKNIITKHSSVDHLRVTLQKHMHTLFNGVIDDEYVEVRLKVAKAHYRIGLQTTLVFIGFSKLAK